MNPLHAIIKWAEPTLNAHGNTYSAGYNAARKDVTILLEQYRKEPEWVCLEGMTAGELQAFDYGCDLTLGAVLDVLNGKSKGGVANGPWQSVRERLEALVDFHTKFS